MCNSLGWWSQEPEPKDLVSGGQLKTVTQTMKTEQILLSCSQRSLRTPRNKYHRLYKTSSIEAQAVGTISKS